jgi:hypothetical protein
MSSDAQLAANRANAELSTGPKTPEGKAKSSLNAVKTALTGQTVLLPSDDVAAYESHVQSFIDHYNPATPREKDLVQSIADTTWRMKRIPSLEAAILARGSIELKDMFEDQAAELRPQLIAAEVYLRYEKQIHNLHLQEARLFRRFQQECRELEALQQESAQQMMDALAISARIYEKAKAEKKPITTPIVVNGFEFSIEQVEDEVERMNARRAAYPGSRDLAA